MTKITGYIRHIALYLFVVMFFACSQPGGNDPGSEYMPDMAHSIAFEANHYNYYYLNTWGSKDAYYKMAQPRLPVEGTIPRGYAGGADGAASKGIAFTANSAVPYYYADSDEERTRAMNEIISNPYPITDAGLADGKELYEIFCGICHGDKGDGNGYLAREDGGKYPVLPANLISEEFIAATNGRFYHAIMYGKNVMGSYKDKISYEERWQVIHYIRSLQAKELKLEYNQLVNTLNDVEVPAGPAKEVVHEAHDDDHHGDDHGHGHDAEQGGDHHSDDHSEEGHH